MVMDKMDARSVVDTLAFSLLATYLPFWGLTILCVLLVDFSRSLNDMMD